MNLAEIIHKALDLVAPTACVGCGKAGTAFCRACADASHKHGAQCLFCGFRNKDGRFCPSCLKKELKEAGLASTPLKRVLWAGNYNGALRKAIHGLKYKKRKELAKPLGEMLAKKFFEIHKNLFLAQRFERHEYPPASGFLCSRAETAAVQDLSKRVLSTNFIIFPIPLHFKKEHSRGFNQAALIGKEFSRITGIPLVENILIKKKETLAQVEVENRQLRTKNLGDAFSVDLRKINNLITQPFNHLTIILIDDVATTGSTLLHASEALSKAGLKNVIALAVAHGRD